MKKLFDELRTKIILFLISVFASYNLFIIIEIKWGIELATVSICIHILVLYLIIK